MSSRPRTAEIGVLWVYKYAMKDDNVKRKVKERKGDEPWEAWENGSRVPAGQLV